MWQGCKTAKVSGLGTDGQQLENRVGQGDVLRWVNPEPGVIIEGTVAAIKRSGSDVRVRLHPVATVMGSTVLHAPDDYTLPPTDEDAKAEGVWYAAEDLVLHLQAGAVAMDRSIAAMLEARKQPPKRQGLAPRHVPVSGARLDSAMAKNGRVRRGATVQYIGQRTGVTAMTGVVGAIYQEAGQPARLALFLWSGPNGRRDVVASEASVVRLEKKGGRR